MGTFTIHPNLFVVLVAGSGRCRKSTSIDQAELILNQLDSPAINIISQKITPEALIDALMIKKQKGKKIIKLQSVGFVIADELSVFLNTKSYDAGLGSLLVPLWDCRSFSYRTKGRGIEQVTDSCLGLIGASTIDWLRKAIPTDAVGGGLTSRIMFVYVEESPPPIARPRPSKKRRLLNRRLVELLSYIQTLSGPVIVDPEVWGRYEEDYGEWYEKSPFYDQPILSGYASRRFVHLFKIAICIAAAASPVGSGKEILIQLNHYQAALETLRRCEPLMPRILNLITATEQGALLELIHTKIAAYGAKGVERARLLRHMIHRVTARDLEEITRTLEASRRITVVHCDGDTHYMIRLIH